MRVARSSKCVRNAKLFSVKTRLFFSTSHVVETTVTTVVEAICAPIPVFRWCVSAAVNPIKRTRQPYVAHLIVMLSGMKIKVGQCANKAMHFVAPINRQCVNAGNVRGVRSSESVRNAELFSVRMTLSWPTAHVVNTIVIIVVEAIASILHLWRCVSAALIDIRNLRTECSALNVDASRREDFLFTDAKESIVGIVDNLIVGTPGGCVVTVSLKDNFETPHTRSSTIDLIAATQILDPNPNPNPNPNLRLHLNSNPNPAPIPVERDVATSIRSGRRIVNTICSGSCYPL